MADHVIGIKVTASDDGVSKVLKQTEDNVKKLDNATKTTGNEATTFGDKFMKAGEKLKNVGGKMEELAGKMTVFSGAAAGLITASLASFNNVDKGMDIIVTKTGATGKALERMQDTAKDIATTIPVSFEEAGSAVGEVNTRFGVTGDELEELSTKFLKFSQLNNTDVSTSIDGTQKALAAFGMEGKDAGKLLDTLNAVGQRTGIDMGTLTQTLTKNGAQLQEMGFNAYQAAEFLGNVEVSGIDTTQAMTGMQKAMKYASDNGKTLQETLADFDSVMKSNKSDTEKLQMAYDIFGARAGAAIYNAAKTGSLSFEMLADSGEANLGNLDKTYENTQDGIDKMKTAFNALKEAGAEVGAAFGDVFAPMLQKITNGLKKFAQWFKNLSPAMKNLIAKVGLLTAAAAPALKIGGKIVGKIGTLVTGIGSFAKKAGEAGGALQALSGSGNGLLGTIGKLATSMIAHPWTIAIAGAAALGAAIAGLVLHYTQATRESEKLAKQHQEQIASVQGEFDMTREYTKELEALAGKEEKTASDKAYMKFLVDQLNGSVDGLNLTLDEETGALKDASGATLDNCDAIYNRIDALEAEALAEAYANQAKETYAKIAENNLEIGKKEAELSKVLEQAHKAEAEGRMDEYNQYMTQAANIKTEIGDLENANKNYESELTNVQQAQANTAFMASEQWSKMVADAEAAGYSIPEELKTAMERGNVEVPKTLEDLKGMLDPNYQKLVNQAKANGIEIPSEITEGLKSGNMTVTQASDKLRQIIAQRTKSDGQAGKNGAATGKEYTDSFGRESDKAGAKAKAAKDTAVKNLNDNGRGRSLGASLGSGWLNGMSGYFNSAIARAQSAVNTIIAKMKAAQASHSPSKKTMKLGQYLAEGYAEGIDAKADLVQKAAEGLVQNSLGEIDTNTSLAATQTIRSDLSGLRSMMPRNTADGRLDTLISMLNGFIGGESYTPANLSIDGRTLAQATGKQMNAQLGQYAVMAGRGN